MTNFMFIVIVVIVLAVVVLFGTVFGKQLRVKMRGRTDEMMRQDAQTPEGAKDYYNAAIREKEEFYNRASVSFAEISGKRKATQDDLHQANKDIMQVTNNMNACIDGNKDDEAMQYARKKSTLENKINVLKDTLVEMKEAEAHQKEIMEQAAEELQRLREEKEQVIFQMEADSQIIELHQSMDSLSMNNESERMLERVREGAEKEMLVRFSKRQGDSEESNSGDNMFRVIIAGSRSFANYEMLKANMNRLLQNISDEISIVCGTARGADRLGEKYAKEMGFHVAYFPADWERYGKAAGYIRNKEMAQNADALVAFWDGESRGTKSMIDLAKEYDLAVRVLKF